MMKHVTRVEDAGSDAGYHQAGGRWKSPGWRMLGVKREVTRVRGCWE